MSFKFPDVRVQRINFKPLVPDGGLQQIDPQRTLKRLQREVLKAIQKHLQQEPFSHRAKRALKEGMETRLGPNSITVIAKHPAFRPLLEGQHSGQMTWLTKARAPIPIITDEGELIFRSATPRSMQNGSWYHPGRKPTTVLEKARAEARGVLKKKISADIRKQIKAAAARAKR